MAKFFTNDKTMLLMVIINTITIFIGGFGIAPTAFLFIDALFTLLFLCEAIVKIRTYGWDSYWHENWNKFDFIITLIAVPSLANLFIEGSIATNILLSLRTLRVFKSFRLLKFIPNIEGLIRGVGQAIKASFVVTLAFVVLMLIVSILSSALFGSIAPELFGNPGASTYTIFRLFTGEGWNDIPDLVASRSTEAMGVLVKVMFSFLFFSGGILGLSLVNSIFVDAMAEDNNDEVLKRLTEIEGLIKKEAYSSNAED